MKVLIERTNQSLNVNLYFTETIDSVEQLRRLNLPVYVLKSTAVETRFKEHHADVVVHSVWLEETIAAGRNGHVLVETNPIWFGKANKKEYY